DEAGVAEDGNGDNEPDDAHGQSRETISNEANDGLDHRNGGAALLQNDTDDGAQNNHQPNVAQNPAKPIHDDAGGILQWQTIRKCSQEGGGEQHEKRVEVQLRSRYDNKYDDRKQDNHEAHNFSLAK